MEGFLDGGISKENILSVDQWKMNWRFPTPNDAWKEEAMMNVSRHQGISKILLKYFQVISNVASKKLFNFPWVHYKILITLGLLISVI